MPKTLANQVRKQLSDIIAPKTSCLFAFFCCSPEPRDASTQFIEGLISLLTVLAPKEKKVAPSREQRYRSLPSVTAFSANTDAYESITQHETELVVALLRVAQAYIVSNQRQFNQLMHTAALITQIGRHLSTSESLEDIGQELVGSLRTYILKPTPSNARALKGELEKLVITGPYQIADNSGIDSSPEAERRSLRSESLIIPVGPLGDNDDLALEGTPLASSLVRGAPVYGT